MGDCCRLPVVTGSIPEARPTLEYSKATLPNQTRTAGRSNVVVLPCAHHRDFGSLSRSRLAVQLSQGKRRSNNLGSKGRMA